MSVAHWQAAIVYRWSWRRPVLALGISLMLHALLVGQWPSGGRSAVGMTPPLQAQLQIPAEPAPPVAKSAEPSRDADVSPPSRPVSAASSRAGRQADTAVLAEERPTPTNAGSNIPDSRFIPARELDRYPAPVTPLDLRDMGITAATVRVWVSIDLAGAVVDVAVTDADPTGNLQRQLREYLRTVRFLPGIKDERPVRSRILLELAVSH